MRSNCPCLASPPFRRIENNVFLVDSLRSPPCGRAPMRFRARWNARTSTIFSLISVSCAIWSLPFSRPQLSPAVDSASIADARKGIPGHANLRRPKLKKQMNPDAKTETATSSHDATTDTVPQPPVARREPVEHALHGDRRVDHYAWLRQKKIPMSSPTWKPKTLTRTRSCGLPSSFKKSSIRKCLAGFRQTDFTVPYRLRGYLYFTRTHEGKQYRSFPPARAEGSPEELLLDLKSACGGPLFFGARFVGCQ